MMSLLKPESRAAIPGKSTRGRAGSRLHIAALGVCACFLVLPLACTSNEDMPDPTPVNSQVQTFGGAGSTFVAPLVNRWAEDYKKLHQVQVNYRPIGSGGGLGELRRGILNFAASDAPLGDDQLKGMPPIVQIPVTAGPVCVTYNLPTVSAPLRLSGKTVAAIFSGDVISWQDPAIASENSGVKLPHAAIIVVHRSDGSGTTSIFTDYLSSASAGWSAKVGHGISVNWPVGLGEDGSAKVIAIVKENPGTVGYAELSYAKQAGLPVASVQNKAADYVAPSPSSASLAIDAFEDALAKDLRTPIVNPPASAKGAYPISGLTYVLIPRDNTFEGQQRAFRDFIEYAITQGQGSAEEMYYSRLPVPVQQQSQALLAQLTENGHPLP
jgi:phosphate transport system substrate-binding protein